MFNSRAGHGSSITLSRCRCREGIKLSRAHTSFVCHVGDVVNPPACRNSVEQLGLVEDRVGLLMGRLDTVNIWDKRQEMDDEQFSPVVSTAKKVKCFS